MFDQSGHQYMTGNHYYFANSFVTLEVTTNAATTTPIDDDSNWEVAIHICSKYIMPSVCLFGILGNTINLTILTRRPMRRSSPYTYLLGLAVTDMTVLSLSLVDFIISSALHSTSYWSVMFNAFVFYPISNIFTSSSVWITVLLTVERYVSVRYPLKAKELCTRKLAKRTMCLVVFLASVFNVPRFFGYEVRHCGLQHYEKVSSSFEASPSFNAMTWFYICTVHFLPYALLIYLNAGLILTVLKANRQRSALRCISRSFKSITVTSHRLSIFDNDNICNVGYKNANDPDDSVNNNILNNIKTRQRKVRMLKGRSSSVTNAESELLQMKENYRCRIRIPFLHSPRSSLESGTCQINQLLGRTEARSSCNMRELRPSRKFFDGISSSRPTNSAILLPQMQGKSIKLFQRRFTNSDLYIFGPPNRITSCVSLPGVMKHDRVSSLCQDLPIQSSASFIQQQQPRILSQRQSNYFSSEQMRMTVTCISIICLFLLCIIPSAFSNRPIAKALFGKGLSMVEFTRGRFYNRLRTATNFLVYCNLSLNFVLYCVFNHRFLVTLKRLVQMRFQKIASTCGRVRHTRPSRGGVYGNSVCRYYRREHQLDLSGGHRESEALEVPSDSSIVRRQGYKNFRRNRSFDCGNESFWGRRKTHANGCHSE